MVFRRTVASKGWARELLIVAARCVHARKENRFEASARNIICIMRDCISTITIQLSMDAER